MKLITSNNYNSPVSASSHSPRPVSSRTPQCLECCIKVYSHSPKLKILLLRGLWLISNFLFGFYHFVSAESYGVYKRHQRELKCIKRTNCFIFGCTCHTIEVLAVSLNIYCSTFIERINLSATH